VANALTADEITRGDTVLRKIIERLVATFDPERIYLFGSRARGDHTSESDYDVMVLVDSSDEPSYRRAQRAYRVIGAVGASKDVLVWTRAEYDSQRHGGASLAAAVQRDGVTVYAR